jgi:glycosyltransferase involved in cell wall biosynthesis
VKILQISYSNYKGGASRAAWRIHQSMLKNRINSDFLVINPDWNISNKLISPYSKFDYQIFFIKRIIGSVISKIFLLDKFSIQSLSLFQSNLYKFINNSDYDIVNLHWICAEMMSIEDIAKIEKPIVWTLHDMWPFTATEHFTFDTRWKFGYYKKKKNVGFLFLKKLIWKRKIIRWKNKKFFIVGVSNWISKCATKSFLFKNNKIQTINNTLDLNFWKPINKNISRKYFNLPNNIKIFGHGALGTANSLLKGRDLIENSLKILKIKKTDLIILNFGDSVLSEEVGVKVINLGKLNTDIDIRYFYNSLDLFICPSRLESFGQTALEAQSCGVPVLCFDTSGLKDIVVHKKNGFFIRGFSISKFVKGIDFFLKITDSEHKKMSNYSRNYALKNFSYKKIAKEYSCLYKKILDSIKND